MFYRNRVEKIQIMRLRLKTKITELITKYGPSLYEDFERQRYIQDQSFSSDEGNISNTSSRKYSYMNDLALNQAFESLTELGL